jgi:hypothetical protein
VAAATVTQDELLSVVLRVYEANERDCAMSGPEPIIVSKNCVFCRKNEATMVDHRCHHCYLCAECAFGNDKRVDRISCQACQLKRGELRRKNPQAYNAFVAAGARV